MFGTRTGLLDGLAARGKAMNRSLATAFDSMCEEIPGELWFPLAVAYALVWSGHAVEDEDYGENAVEYLLTGEEELLSGLAHWSGRNGGACLQSALSGWRGLMEIVPVPNTRTIGARELCEFQEGLLTIAGDRNIRGGLHGIGPWVFCGPFKVLALMRRDLWSDEALDELYMPLGLEVERGLGALKRQGFGVPKALLPTRFVREGNFMGGMARLVLAQRFQQTLARSARMRVLHINSGLYELGVEAAESRRAS
jgi:hypothetical protein